MKYLITVCLLAQVLIAAAQPERRTQDDKVGFWSGDRWVIPPTFEDAGAFHRFAYAPAKSNGKWGLIDQKGNVVLNFVYEAESNEGYESPYWNVKLNGKNGVVSLRQGRELVKPIYDSYVTFDEYPFDATFGNVILATRNGLDGVIDTTGAEFISCKYDHPSLMSFDSTRVQAKLKGKRGLLDRTGSVVIPFEYDLITDDLGADDQKYITVRKGKRYGLYAWDGRLLAPALYDGLISMEMQGYAILRSGKRYGVLHQSGQVYVPVEFDGIDVDMGSNPEQLLYIVRKGNKKGIYASDGSVLAQPVYEVIDSFDGNEFAMVTRDGLIGLMNRSGKLVIPCVHKDESTLLEAKSKLKE